MADIAAAVPSSVAVLQAYGIDFCCGGRRAIGEVCRDHGLVFNDVSEAIDASTRTLTAANRDWRCAPLHALVDHIVSTYHVRLRQDLPRLEALASKARRAHEANAPHLVHVEELLGELSADLSGHMRKEEQVLFPAIRALEAGDARQSRWLAAPVTVMEQEHERAGALLTELRRTTDGYVAPEWACTTLKALYQGLEELERSMHVHVHLENNVLFPRAMEAAESLQPAR